MTAKDNSAAQGFTSVMVHTDRRAAPGFGAVHQPIHNSVPYGYDDAQGLVDVFQGKVPGHAYARQSTPTMNALADKICQMEQGANTLVYGSGMAAITAILLTLLKSGDHLVASQFLFGNTVSIFDTLKGYGIDVTLVDVTDAKNVEAGIQDNTRMVFLETIANPVTQVADLLAIGDICEQHNLLYVVDNTMASSYLFQPVTAKVGLIVNSLSKYFGGHGNAIGGSVTDTGLFDWSTYPNIFVGYQKGDPTLWGLNQLKKKGLRDMGAALSSTAAHQLSIGAETMALRLDRCCSTALELALMLEAHPKVAKVYYPGLKAHPQHALASELFRHYGGLLSLDLVDGIDCVEFLNHLDLVINATHLGDNRTLALPVAPTIYHELGLENRQKMGISETMIRCSIGIEDTEDLLNDFIQALDKV